MSEVSDYLAEGLAMELLSSDPTIPAVILGMAVLGCLVMLKVSQQGKYLFYGVGALVFLLVWLGIERVWVTDEERVEAVVYGLADAVRASDADRAADFLTADCSLEPKSDSGNMAIGYVIGRFGRSITRDQLREVLPTIHFDWVKITKLETHVGATSRLRTAEFIVHAMAMGQAPTLATPPAGMGWSLGLREVEPGVWKVARVSPGRAGGQ